MKKYLELIKITFINCLDYRKEIVTELIVGILVFAGQYVFWGMVFSDNETVKLIHFARDIELLSFCQNNF